MGRAEIQTAVTTLVAAQRAAYASGMVGANNIILGYSSPGTASVAILIATLAFVHENSISQANLDILNAAATQIQTGATAMANAIQASQDAIEAANAALRNE